MGPVLAMLSVSELSEGGFRWRLREWILLEPAVERESLLPPGVTAGPLSLEVGDRGVGGFRMGDTCG